MQLDTLIELLKKKREELGNVTVVIPADSVDDETKLRPVDEAFQMNAGTPKKPRTVLFLAPL